MAADGQDREVRPEQVADQGHVPERGRVAGVVDPEPVLELDHEPDRLAEVVDRLAAHRVAGGVDRGHHRDPQAARLDRAALVHADDLGRLAQLAAEVQAQLVNARHRRLEPPREGERVGVEVVEVAMRHEEHVAGRLLLLGPRAVRIAEPGIDQHGPAARRDDLHAGVPQPGERGVATERHAGTSCRRAAASRVRAVGVIIRRPAATLGPWPRSRSPRTSR